MEEDSVLLCDMIRPSSGEERGEGGREQDEGGVVEQTVGGGWWIRVVAAGLGFFGGRCVRRRCQHSVEKLTSSRRQTRRKTPRSRSEIYSRSLETRIKVIFVFLLLLVFLFSSISFTGVTNALWHTVIRPPEYVQGNAKNKPSKQQVN